MRIRTSRRLSRDTAEAAAQFASRVSGAEVSIYHFRHHKAQYPYHHGYEVRLRSDGSLRRHRVGDGSDHYAATYEQWGHFINYLMSTDPTMRAGDYVTRADFDAAVGDAALA